MGGVNSTCRDQGSLVVLLAKTCGKWTVPVGPGVRGGWTLPAVGIAHAKTGNSMVLRGGLVVLIV